MRDYRPTTHAATPFSRRNAGKNLSKLGRRGGIASGITRRNAIRYRDSKIVKRLTRGHSYRRIAASHSLTRNAISGVAARHRALLGYEKARRRLLAPPEASRVLLEGVTMFLRRKHPTKSGFKGKCLACRSRISVGEVRMIGSYNQNGLWRSLEIHRVCFDPEEAVEILSTETGEEMSLW